MNEGQTPQDNLSTGLRDLPGHCVYVGRGQLAFPLDLVNRGGVFLVAIDPSQTGSGFVQRLARIGEKASYEIDCTGDEVRLGLVGDSPAGSDGSSVVLVAR